MENESNFPISVKINKKYKKDFKDWFLENATRDFNLHLSGIRFFDSCFAENYFSIKKLKQYLTPDPNKLIPFLTKLIDYLKSLPKDKVSFSYTFEPNFQKYNHNRFPTNHKHSSKAEKDNSKKNTKKRKYSSSSDYYDYSDYSDYSYSDYSYSEYSYSDYSYSSDSSSSKHKSSSKSTKKSSKSSSQNKVDEKSEKIKNSATYSSKSKIIFESDEDKSLSPININSFHY
ncbi:hypothetical protein TVAG_271910 [Trichomonas vaginalis G3]|uniref:Uncharacterized protein n=1 Tax=Trichomonas vaginalis (strain ATCC PRA-98 / G3) TaxID=412133 RepID=A2E5T8_TRIV3|nr:hypothetical protein TVAGG3_0256900 [Trichomonas vaginalis G3]EAY12008.1 hypothetical protein TVAG_271910 [Trichomonas vaginalis G3]KAI5524818.1 hypothetical protein TVAGG3_0256900 [Trichomonas vaginalis G3]|eukprot:XP_001324231.1 hypothetical protein [Trichomonas vaginalis G3]